jgi:hypothetical protein
VKIRRFFFGSLFLAVVAIGLQLGAMSQVNRTDQAIACGVTLPESERAAARLEAKRFSRRAAPLAYLGLAFALASAIFVVMSARKREPAWRSVTFALLFFYVMLHFTLI